MLMARAVTLPLIGTLALTGIGVGIQLGYSAIAEIDPIYYSQPETRFHADLSPYRPSTATPPATLAATDVPALGSGCIGCRNYPEEYIPIHEASIDRYSSGFAREVDTSAEARPVPPIQQEEPALRSDIERVAVYARGSVAEPSVQLASAEAPLEQAEQPELAQTE